MGSEQVLRPARAATTPSSPSSQGAVQQEHREQADQDDGEGDDCGAEGGHQEGQAHAPERRERRLAERAGGRVEVGREALEALEQDLQRPSYPRTRPAYGIACGCPA